MWGTWITTSFFVPIDTAATWFLSMLAGVKSS